MPTEPELNGLRVLIPRPQPGADRSAAYLAALGAEVTVFPVLEIEPLAVMQVMRQWLNRAHCVDLLVFVSVPAVEHFFRALHATGGVLPARMQIAAIGTTTATACARFAAQVDFLPVGSSTSEGLVKGLQISDWRGRNATIVRGVGGRAVVENFLRQRGAEVEYLELYRRVVTTKPVTDLLEPWRTHGFAATLIHSGAVFEALLQLLGRDAGDCLNRTDLICPSERVGRICRDHGYDRVVVAAGAGDAEMATVVQTVDVRF